MTHADKAALQAGNWVSGTSFDDEKFIGYIESIHSSNEVIVMVTQSYNEEAVGRFVNSSLSKLTKMADYVPAEQEDFYDLIEFALATKDKVWFDQITFQAAYAASKRSGLKPGSETAAAESRRFPTNRISF